MFRPLDQARCRRALRLPGNGRLVGFVGRFLPEKGIEDLLRAASRLGPSVRVLLVGSGPDLPRLIARAGTLGLGDRLIVRGAMARHRMPVVMGALDALVLPSRTWPEWKEQFGRVLVEAQACGRWALGSSSGEIPAIVAGRQLVFPEGESARLARCLRTVLGRLPPPGLRPRILHRFSEEAVATATTRFLLACRDGA